MEEVAFYVTVIFLTLLVIYLLTKLTGRNRKCMPGPSLKHGIQTFVKGSKDNKLYLYFSQWAQKYGDILQVNLVVKNIVVVNESQVFRRLVKDADYREVTNDRPDSFIRKYIIHDAKEIILAASGPDHEKKRKIFNTILNFYGEGKDHFEQLMITTLQELTETFCSKETIALSASLRRYVLRLVGFLLSGDISNSGQKKLDVLQIFSNEIEKLNSLQNEAFLQVFPWLRFIPGFRFKQLYENSHNAIDKLHETYFYPMKRTFDPENRRGVIDDLLSIQQEINISGSGPQMDDECIKAIVLNIVSAGYLTTSSTLASMFLHLMKHQDVQNRMYQEIEEVIGDTTPSFRHRHQMPYTEAVILEIMRISSTVPLLLPHMVKEDIVFDGYLIPKSTMLIINAWHNHHRQDFWGDPFTFRPDRFLDANGQLLSSDHPIRQKLITFGSGRRACPGETFGKSRVFLITTYLLQQFQVLPADVKMPSLDPRDWLCGTVLGPADYKCRLMPRDH